MLHERAVGDGLVQAGVVVAGDREVVNGWVQYRTGLITRVGSGVPPLAPDLVAAVVLPGFVDQHCHGGGGASFSSADPDQIAEVARIHLAHGTTSVVASLVSEDRPTLLHQVATLAESADLGLIAGIHLEGPWLARGKCGAHDPAVLRHPDPGEISDLLAAARGHLRQVTLAPELPGAMSAINQLGAAGVPVAIGHTECSQAVTREALAHGASIATHLWNAMPALSHRAPGPIPVLLNSSQVLLEIVNDGVHVDQEVIRLTLAAAGRDRVALITDAMGAAAAPDGTYWLSGLQVHVRDRVARLAGSGAIAGSTLTMDEAVRRTRRAFEVSWPDLARLSAGNSARALGLRGIGEIAVGGAADFVLLDEGGQVQTVVKSGVVTPGGRRATV